MILFHKHDWNILVDDAIARYEKQSGQGSAVYFRGRVERCLCQKERFVPMDSALRPVEIEVAA